MPIASRQHGDAQREVVAWSVAGLAAGLPVWALPWRRAQREATATGDGTAETTAEDNYETLRLVFAAYESAASGEVVGIPEGPNRPAAGCLG